MFVGIFYGQVITKLSLFNLFHILSSFIHRIMCAGGLRDLPNANPGEGVFAYNILYIHYSDLVTIYFAYIYYAISIGYTGHSFNDFNHCDLTAMRGDEVNNENEGKVAGIHYTNRCVSLLLITHICILNMRIINYESSACV